MTDDSPLLEVGVVGKANGLRGEVHVRLTSNNMDRLVVGSRLWADLDGGRELVVRSSRRQGDRWVVGFEGITDRNGAEALRGATLAAEPVEDDPDAYWVHDLIGSEVVDVDGTLRGTVVEVMENPASDILVLDGGALVPLRFATWDGPGRLVADVPEGLWDLS